RQGHADDAAFRCCVSRLPDLAVECRHGSGIDQHAALARGFWLVCAHGSGCQPDHIEATDQVDVDHFLKQVQSMGAVTTDGACGRRHSSAVHQPEQLPQCQGCVHGCLAVGFLCDVAVHEHLTEFLGEG